MVCDVVLLDVGDVLTVVVWVVVTEDVGDDVFVLV